MRSGFSAGREADLMPATRDNPRGYWENLGIFRANEAVLDELGATWFDPPSPDRITASRDLDSGLRSAVELLIETAGPAPVVLKDPRIGVLLDLWGPILDGLLHPVLVVRPPTEVAASLAARDGTPRALGLAGWEVHTTRVLHHLRGRRVTVAPYARLLADPGQAAATVNAAAGHLESGRRGLVDSADAPTAMIAALRRHRPDPRELDDCLTAAQARLWGILAGLEPGDQVIEVPSDFTGTPSEHAVEAVRDETRRVAGCRESSDRAMRIDDLNAAFNRVVAERDALGRDRERIAGELAAERAVTAELRAELGRAVHQVDERARHRRDRDTMVAERDSIAAERDSIAAERDVLAAERDEILAQLVAERQAAGWAPRTGSRP